MAQYDTAQEVINAAATECGLDGSTDPFASSAPAYVGQLRSLLSQCGRELATVYQWQEFTKTHTISTGAAPVANGQYALPSDFGYMINQTGWTPTGLGLGLPIAGPLSEQIWQSVVNTNQASSTIYLSFKLADRVLQFLPAPAPPDINIVFSYQSKDWVLVNGGPTTADRVANNSDVLLFDAILISKMLATRYKQAKGLDANSSLEQFQAMYAAISGINSPAPVLTLARASRFPFLNPWINLPQSGYGS